MARSRKHEEPKSIYCSGFTSLMFNMILDSNLTVLTTIHEYAHARHAQITIFFVLCISKLSRMQKWWIT